MDCLSQVARELEGPTSSMLLFPLDTPLSSLQCASGLSPCAVLPLSGLLPGGGKAVACGCQQAGLARAIIASMSPVKGVVSSAGELRVWQGDIAVEAVPISGGIVSMAGLGGGSSCFCRRGRWGEGRGHVTRGGGLAGGTGAGGGGWQGRCDIGGVPLKGKGIAVERRDSHLLTSRARGRSCGAKRRRGVGMLPGVGDVHVGG